jgi:leucyl-tRNA synthetase
VTNDSYVFVTCPTLGGDIDLSRLRSYALADAHARYRRANGEDVLFTLGFDAFASSPKPAEGRTVEDWIERRQTELRRQLDGLALSFDWDRTLLTSDPGVYRWSQWLFSKLLEADLVYQRGGKGWYLRTAAFNEENDRRLDELDGWSDAARATQRALLHHVDGFELEASALDGTTLTLFTPHPDAVGSAELVALSPQLPEAERWLEDPDARRELDAIRREDWSDKPATELPVLQTGMSAQVPGVPQPLPIVVSPSVDQRFGPAAIVGIPSADEADKTIARSLPKLGGLAWKVEAKPAKTSPAVRFFAEDMPLSRGRAWGAPVPAVHCPQCGTVAVPLDELPLEPPADLDVTSRGNALAERDDFLACKCPSCDGEARRDTGTLHPRLGAAWLELALAVPPADRADRMLDHPDLQRWLPTAQTVQDAGAGVAILDMRTVAKALRDAGALTSLPDGEPLGPMLVHAPLAPDSVPALGELIEAHGADAVRFAVLHAAAPSKTPAAIDGALRHAISFLEGLRDFAKPRFEGVDVDARIDVGDGLRRRLAGWCDTAVERVAENYARLDLHRATRNVAELLARIQDFERRVIEHRGELAGADREAAAIALAALVRLLAPLTPDLAAELWGGAGQDGAVAEAGWPNLQREPAAA